jgi:hypothetical protein
VPLEQLVLQQPVVLVVLQLAQLEQQRQVRQLVEG